MDNGPFDATYDDDAQALTVTGELDEAASAALRDAMTEHTAAFTRSVTVDLSEISYLPSAAVGVLAQALQQSAKEGHPIELLAADGTIAQRVLQVCALPHRTS